MASVLVRPISVDDFEALAPIDQAFAEMFGLEAAMTRSSLNFYARSGHAFVSVENAETTGFVLAQSVWNGTKAVVYTYRLAVKDLKNTGNGLASREALTEAVIKSAYDAAVYDLRVLQPDADAQQQGVLEAKAYKPAAVTLYSRTLGSRGQGSQGG